MLTFWGHGFSECNVLLLGLNFGSLYYTRAQKSDEKSATALPKPEDREEQAFPGLYRASADLKSETH